MRYLKKSASSAVIFAELSYKKSSQRAQIRSLLLEEQFGYCAYTEKYVDPIDACDTEHFDDRKKHTDDDGYWNWYAVLHKINQKKAKIEDLLPILLPHSDELAERIQYKNGMFITTQPDDIEAQNLIELLQWNAPYLSGTRNRHVAHIKSVHQFYPGSDDEFIEFLKNDPANLSYITALEAELELTLT